MMRGMEGRRTGHGGAARAVWAARAGGWRGGALVSTVLVLLLNAVPLQTDGATSAARPQATGAWISTWPMTATRGTQTATLLPNGTVLIAGGENSATGDVASAELYHPRTGRFTRTGSMTYAREQHTATLLRTGRVLITGGVKLYAVTNGAELYTPATGTFTQTGAMALGRVDHTATLLRDGRVLVTGGCNGTASACTQVEASAEVYNPATGTFTATGSMSTPRLYQTATLLPSGLVLIAGGATCSACYPLASAELYNPTTGTFTATGSMVTARAFHTATLLRDGQVLVTGGCPSIAGDCNPATNTLTSAELYDPATGTWTATGNMTTPQADHTATLLPSGQVLLAGGQAGGGIVGGPLSSAEVYDPATGTFTVTASMHAARDRFTATLLYNGTVLVTGGCAYSGGDCVSPIVGSAEVYVPGLAARRAVAPATRARRP